MSILTLIIGLWIGFWLGTLAMGWLQAHTTKEAEMGPEPETPAQRAAREAVNKVPPALLMVTYDIRGLTPAEVDALTMEAVVQAEDTDAGDGSGHPSVPVETRLV